MRYSVREIISQHLSSLPPEDFFLLLSFVSRKPKEYLVAHPEHIVSKTTYQKLLTLIRRRIDHEPIAFITGHREFYGFDFLVNRSTLIPRPETEILVESAIENISKHISDRASLKRTQKQSFTIIDVGTGSGNIILSILKTLEKKIALPKLSCFGLDISSEAITLAKKNARALRPLTRTRFIQSDLLQALPARTFHHTKHVYILANLPYLSEKIYQACPTDVKNYEPASALTSAELGCAHIERLLREIHSTHSVFPELPIDIWLEISPEQKGLLAKKIRSLLPESRFEFRKDWSGRYRFILITLHP